VAADSMASRSTSAGRMTVSENFWASASATDVRPDLGRPESEGASSGEIERGDGT